MDKLIVPMVMVRMKKTAIRMVQILVVNQITSNVPMVQIVFHHRGNGKLIQNIFHSNWIQKLKIENIINVALNRKVIAHQTVWMHLMKVNIVKIVFVMNRRIDVRNQGDAFQNLGYVTVTETASTVKTVNTNKIATNLISSKIIGLFFHRIGLFKQQLPRKYVWMWITWMYRKRALLWWFAR